VYKYIFLQLTWFLDFNDIFHKLCIITKREGKSSFYVTSHGTITWKDEYKFDEYLEQTDKKDVKLWKGQSQRLFNVRRQEKLRFQVPKVDGERDFMSLVKKHKEITMSFT
jgi:hypothetical protein